MKPSGYNVFGPPTAPSTAPPEDTGSEPVADAPAPPVDDRRYYVDPDETPHAPMASAVNTPQEATYYAAKAAGLEQGETDFQKKIKEGAAKQAAEETQRTGERVLMSPGERVWDDVIHGEVPTQGSVMGPIAEKTAGKIESRSQYSGFLERSAKIAGAETAIKKALPTGVARDYTLPIATTDAGQTGIDIDKVKADIAKYSLARLSQLHPPTSDEEAATLEQQANEHADAVVRSVMQNNVGLPVVIGGKKTTDWIMQQPSYARPGLAILLPETQVYADTEVRPNEMGAVGGGEAAMNYFGRIMQPTAVVAGQMLLHPERGPTTREGVESLRKGEDVYTDMGTIGQNTREALGMSDQGVFSKGSGGEWALGAGVALAVTGLDTMLDPVGRAAGGVGTVTEAGAKAMAVRHATKIAEAADMGLIAARDAKDGAEALRIVSDHIRKVDPIAAEVFETKAGARGGKLVDELSQVLPGGTVQPKIQQIVTEGADASAKETELRTASADAEKQFDEKQAGAQAAAKAQLDRQMEYGEATAQHAVAKKAFESAADRSARILGDTEHAAIPVELKATSPTGGVDWVNTQRNVYDALGKAIKERTGFTLKNKAILDSIEKASIDAGEAEDAYQTAKQTQKQTLNPLLQKEADAAAAYKPLEGEVRYATGRPASLVTRSKVEPDFESVAALRDRVEATGQTHEAVAEIAERRLDQLRQAEAEAAARFEPLRGSLKSAKGVVIKPEYGWDETADAAYVAYEDLQKARAEREAAEEWLKDVQTRTAQERRGAVADLADTEEELRRQKRAARAALPPKHAPTAVRPEAGWGEDAAIQAYDAREAYLQAKAEREAAQEELTAATRRAKLRRDEAAMTLQQLQKEHKAVIVEVAAHNKRVDTLRRGMIRAQANAVEQTAALRLKATTKRLKAAEQELKKGLREGVAGVGERDKAAGKLFDQLGKETRNARLADFNAQFRKIVQQEAEEFSRSFKAVPEFIRQKPRTYATSPLAAVGAVEGRPTGFFGRKAATTGQSVVKGAALRSELERRYGAAVVEQFLKNGGPEARALAKFLGMDTIRLKGPGTEAMQRVLDQMEVYAKQQDVAQRGLGTAHMVMQAWMDEHMPAKTLSRSLAKMYATALASFSPDISRTGPSAEILHTVLRQFENRIGQADIEMIQTAEKAGPGRHKIGIIQYIDNTGALEADTSIGKTFLNRGARSRYEIARDLILTQATIAGDDLVKVAELPGFEALSRAWAPPGTDLQPWLGMLRGATLQNLKSAETFGEFMDLQKGFAAGKFADFDYRAERAYTIGGAAIVRTSFQAEAAQDLMKGLGAAITPEEARDINAFLTGNLGKVTDVDRAVNGLVKLGIPFKQANWTKPLEKASSVSRALVEISLKGERAFVPQNLLHEMNSSLENLIKEVDAYHAATPVDASYKRAAAGYFKLWKHSAISGLGYPRPKAWTNNVFDFFSQTWSSQGLGKAVQLTFSDPWANLPFFDRVFKQRIAQLSEWAQGKPVLSSVTNAMFNPAVNAVMSGREGFYVNRAGRVWSYDSLRKMAVDAGAFDTQISEDLLSLIHNLARRSYSREMWENLGLGKAFAEHAANVQSRQRAAFLWDLVVDQGVDVKRATKLMNDALYDWKHGFSQIESYWAMRHVPFYRYYKLSTEQAFKMIFEPFTNGAFGQPSRLARVAGMQRVKEIGERYMEGPPPDDVSGDQLHLEALKYMAALYHPRFMGNSRPTWARPMPNWYETYWRQSEGRAGALDEMVVLPPFTPLEAMERALTVPQMALHLGAFVSGHGRQSGNDPVIADDIWQRWTNPWVSSFDPGAQQVVETFVDLADKGDYTLRDQRVSPGEKVFLQGFGHLYNGDYDSFVREDQKTGQTKATPWMLQAFRLIPFFGNQLPDTMNSVLRQPYMFETPGHRAEYDTTVARFFAWNLGVMKTYPTQVEKDIGILQRDTNDRLNAAADYAKKSTSGR